MPEFDKKRRETVREEFRASYGRMREEFVELRSLVKLYRNIERELSRATKELSSLFSDLFLVADDWTVAKEKVVQTSSQQMIGFFKCILKLAPQPRVKEVRRRAKMLERLISKKTFEYHRLLKRLTVIRKNLLESADDVERFMDEHLGHQGDNDRQPTSLGSIDEIIRVNERTMRSREYASRVQTLIETSEKRLAFRLQVPKKN